MEDSLDWTGDSEEEKIKVIVDSTAIYNLALVILQQMDTVIGHLEDYTVFAAEVYQKDETGSSLNSHVDKARFYIKDFHHLESMLEPILLTYIDECEEEDADELIERHSILIESLRSCRDVVNDFSVIIEAGIAVDNLLEKLGGLDRLNPN